MHAGRVKIAILHTPFSRVYAGMTRMVLHFDYMSDTIQQTKGQREESTSKKKNKKKTHSLWGVVYWLIKFNA